MIRLLVILAAGLPALVLGETAIRIQGSTLMSEQELLRAMSGRLDHIRENPATRPRAADAAFMVERIFERAGYNEVEVFWKVLGPREIQLRVEEGARDLLGEVEVLGVDDPELRDHLVKLFQLAPQKAARGLDALPVQPSSTRKGLQLIRNKLKSLGYHEAAASVEDRTRQPDSKRIDFRIRVDRGPLFQLGRAEIEGETAPGVRQLFTRYRDQDASTENLNGLRSKVAEAYEKAGFINASIRMSLRQEGRRMIPEFFIERGERFRLRRVEIEGLEKTKPDRLTTRLAALQGSYLDAGKSSARVRQMIATGAFSTIETAVTPVGEGQVDVTLRVEEADARGLSGTLGYDNFEGFIIGGGYYDRNFLGQVRNLSAGFELTQRSLLGIISLSDPWIAGSDVAGKLQLSSVTRDQIGYFVWRTGLEASAIWQPDRHYTIEAALAWDHVDTDPDGIPVGLLGPLDYENPYLRITQTLDFRDNPILPTRGWHLDLPIELGLTLAEEQNAYIKAGLGGSFHHRVSERSQWAFGARAGVLFPAESGQALPIDVRYFSGGARSVRSFQERRLGPQAPGGDPVGGEAYWVANVEYIRKVAGPLKLAGFIDAGGVSETWDSFGMSEPEIALGVGIRLDLPVGPVRLEYGHNLTQDPGEPSGSWHFAIGTAF